MGLETWDGEDMAKIAAGSQYFAGGADSNTNPSFLGGSQYVMGMNVVNRGGIIQTRPGFRALATLPPGNFQGMTVFRPTDGRVTIVAAVDGLIYEIPEPFDRYDILTGIAFHPDAKFIVMKEVLQTTAYDENGVPYFLANPRNILVIQDRLTRAAFWDGSTARHLNPESPERQVRDPITREPIPQPGFNEVPVGLWMEFSGNRLWVGRENQVFASDFGNPLRFTEQLYLAEGRAFYMPEPVTGMIQRNAGSPLIVFGENSHTILRSDILDRTQWLNTPEFQISDNSVGCIAGRSIVQSYGQVWWYSKDGLTNLNAALQLNLDSRFRYYDSPMAISKGNMSPIKEGICGISYENYLLMSVPSGDVENKHSWVLDQSPTPEGNPAWNGYWQGVRPIQWGKASMGGEQRVFCASVDLDGGNRIWEAFTPDRTDCGCAITSWVMTKNETWGDGAEGAYKRFNFADIYVDEILDHVSLSVGYAGSRGAYKEILNKEIVATPGVFNSGNETFSLESKIYGHRVQSRSLRTQEAANTEDPCDGCGIESDRQSFVDREFGLLILWSGRMGLKGYRMWADVNEGDQEIRGKCEENEEPFRSVSEEGCGALESLVDSDAYPLYHSNKTVTIACPGEDGATQTNSAFATSRISQEDADRKAICAATLKAESQITCFIPEILINEEGAILINEDGDILTT